MPCALCGEIMNSGEGTGMNSFLTNPTNPADPLGVFSGKVFHKRCFRQHPLAPKARLAKRWLRLRRVCGRTATPSCVTCGEELAEPLVTTGFLTIDRDSPLFEFNFLYAHPECADDWSRADDYAKTIRELERVGGWDGEPWSWRGPREKVLYRGANR